MKWAIIDGDVVVNVILAESEQIAAEVTSGLEVVETTGIPWIGWTRIGGEWRPPTPYPSWVWDGSEWIAPIPMPSEGGPWMWDEDSLSWVTVTQD